MADIVLKAKKEVERIRNIEDRQIAKGKKKKITQLYTISQFVSDVMTASFTEEYLRTTKRTGQATKRGQNTNKKTMHPSDTRNIIRKYHLHNAIKQEYLTFNIATTGVTRNAWKGLPNCPKSELVKKVNESITTKFNNASKSKASQWD